ncbi:MAG: hypothetical protein IJ282_04255 [Lachnospiraceae bacterium]|nr:hypothetical protein [Lachnospiraceae bacterium]
MLSKNRQLFEKCIWMLSIAILFLYPLCHVNIGVDLWDGGYNFANFRYAGTEYMDSMWFFATYIANSVGSFFSVLPFGDTMIGMNVYTGLVVSAMAVGSYIFGVKKWKVPAWIAFMGEFTAIGLCWAPTTMLYSYLTYAFFLGALVLLYFGLTKDSKWYYILAGIVLGLNVGVRFSNLAHIALILLVWIFGFLCKKKFLQVLRETGFCVLGYVMGLGVFLLFITVFYGIGDYVDGVLRLFQMTEVAIDYKVTSMLWGIVGGYFESSYWLKRFALLGGVGILVCLVFSRKWIKVKQTLCVVFSLGIMWWLSRKGFYTKDYASLFSVYYPCVMVLTMTIGLAVWEIVDSKKEEKEKIPALLVLFTLLISPLGGNSAMYCNINNMFLVAPWFLWMVWKTCLERKQIVYFPIKCMLIVSLFFWLVQSVRFGTMYVYEEADGGRNMKAKVQGVPVLDGMITEEEKARKIEEMYGYVEKSGLQTKECILFGQIPGAACYLELAPAMNIWADLRSYGYETMKADLQKIEQELAAGAEKPVVILEARHGAYLLGETEEKPFLEETAEPKLWLISDFMIKNEYEPTFRNEMFVVFE